MSSGSGTPDDPWKLNTPLGKAELEMHRDEGKDVLHCQVGSTWLHYRMSALDDLHAMLVEHGDWMELGNKDEKAETKPGTTHIYKRRKFYVDEDGWQIRLVDIYDRRDELWRFQEAHTVLAYDKPFQVPIGETIYDLQNGRYLVQALNNEHPENVEREFDADYFKPSNVSRQATR